MTGSPEKDGRGTPRPPIIKQLEGTDLIKAGRSWYEASRLPDVPGLTAKEVALLWLVGAHDLNQREAGALLGISYQRSSALILRSFKKIREAVPE